MIIIKNFILDSIIHSLILTALFSYLLSYKVTLHYLVGVIAFSIVTSYINHKYFPNFTVSKLIGI